MNYGVLLVSLAGTGILPFEIQELHYMALAHMMFNAERMGDSGGVKVTNQPITAKISVWKVRLKKVSANERTPYRYVVPSLTNIMLIRG